MTNAPTILLAGATGDLGGRIARALRGRGARVRALLRPDASVADAAGIEATGADVMRAEVNDVSAVAGACAGAACVVSALNGLREVVIDRQGVLLDAAVRAGVRRFISSDYSLDFTKTEPGGNRNLDLRREFMARADRSAIRVTSILNGAFTDMLGAEMPIIRPRLARVIYWGRADQPMDFTAKDDVAAFTAAAALDPDPPRVLRIAGEVVTPRDVAAAMTEATGRQFKTLRVGGLGGLGAMIRVAKSFGPPGAVFPPFQGMQYLRDMMSGRGKLHPLDNDRYPGLTWTTVRSHLKRLRAEGRL